MNFLNMSFHNGTTRFVVTIPWLGVALKFAHIHPIRALQTIIWTAEMCIGRKKEGLLMEMLQYPDEISHSVRWQFRGIYCNLRERRFYRESVNPFLWPTTFSLFGLINIQPFARNQPSCKDHKVWLFIIGTIGDMVWKDCHAFNEESNYAVDVKGYLRMLDYGGSRSQEVIREFGEQLYAQSHKLFS